MITHLRLSFLFMFILAFGSLAAQPPAVVVVEPIREGVLAPDGVFLGTIYYIRQAVVATEVEGRVDAVFVEAGQRVQAGDELVRLNNDILLLRLKAEQARLDQIQAELDKAQLDLRRSERLFAENSIPEQVLDDDRAVARVRQAQLQAQEAEVNRIRAEIAKKSIAAPFDGVVLEKITEVGEWLGTGGRIARIAHLHEVDIIVNVPQEVVPFLRSGMEIETNINDSQKVGKLFAVVPQGDVASRSFPARVRLNNDDATLFEGMEGQIRLPTGPQVECLKVPRDAVLYQPGAAVVFTAEDGLAQRHEVAIIGYNDGFVGVSSHTLRAGMLAVTKGNERLRPGQALDVREDPEPISAGS